MKPIFPHGVMEDEIPDTMVISRRAQELHNGGQEVVEDFSENGLPVATGFRCLNERPLFFIHVPKTAGASVNHFLEAQFDDRDVFPGWNLHDLLLHGTERDSYFLYRGHFPGGLRHYAHKDVEIFAITRRPLAQMYSFFAWMRRVNGSYWRTAEASARKYGHKLKVGRAWTSRRLSEVAMRKARRNSFEDMVRQNNYLTRVFFHDVQMRFLSEIGSPFGPADIHHKRMLSADSKRARNFLTGSARRNLASCLVAGVFEQLDKSLLLLCHKRFWPAPDRLLRIHSNKERRPVRAVSDKAKRLVNLIAPNDRRLYAQAATQLEHQWLDFCRLADGMPYDEFLNARHCENFFEHAQKVYAVDLAASKAWPGVGWGHRERNEHGQVWRWIGAGSKASILLPLISGSDYLLGLYIHTAIDAAVLDSLGCMANGEMLMYAGQGHREGYPVSYWLIDRSHVILRNGELEIQIYITSANSSHALALARIVCHPW
jgi:hypothetical protein